MTTNKKGKPPARTPIRYLYAPDGTITISAPSLMQMLKDMGTEKSCGADRAHTPRVPTCPKCSRPTHASDSNDHGVCAECLGGKAIRP